MLARPVRLLLLLVAMIVILTAMDRSSTATAGMKTALGLASIAACCAVTNRHYNSIYHIFTWRPLLPLKAYAYWAR